MTKITLTGKKELDILLKQLPKEITANDALGKAHLQAAKILVEKEKLTAPEGPTGNLVDSIGATRTSVKKQTRLGQVIVGPRRKGRYKGFAGHLVEYGTKRRKTKKTKANRGVMPKHPFAAPSFEATRTPMKEAIRVNLSKIVVKALIRYAPK